MLKPLLSMLSPAGAHARLPMLIFHRVAAKRDPLSPGEIDADRFEAICRWLRHWYQVIPVRDGVARLRDGTLPARAMGITFDDGYADNHDVALPILQRYGLTATFFISTGFIDGGCMWNDKVIHAIRQCPGDVLRLSHLQITGVNQLELRSAPQRQQAIGALLNALKYLAMPQRLALADGILAAAKAQAPDTLMMTSAQVEGLCRGGMHVGGHTVNHPILAMLNDTEAWFEIAHGRRQLEAMAQVPVDLFAYPNGRPGTDYTARDVTLVKQAGFSAAVSTAWGAARAGADSFQLPRFTPWDHAQWRFGLRLAMNLRQPVHACPAPAPVTGAAASDGH